MPSPKVTPLAGSYDELSGEERSETLIEEASRIEHPDGRVEFVVRRTSTDYPWEARLLAEAGSRQFSGTAWGPDWDGMEKLEAELWVSPNGDEWLLIGEAELAGEEPVVFRMVLFEHSQGKRS